MKLKDSVKQYLRTFAIAAATILTACALNSPATAEIVYHSADIGISAGTYNLDVNGDGVTDLTFAKTYGSGSCGLFCSDEYASLYETPASGNGAIVGPLKSGQEIGPNEVFDGNQAFMAEVRRLRVCYEAHCKYSTLYSGPWLGRTGYLGLSFQLNGQTYYGWALLKCAGRSAGLGAGTATLLGYAYETIPGRAILAGETTYIQFTPTRLDLGTVTLGSTASGSATLANLGPTAVTITNAILTPLNKADFASENGNPPCAGSVAAGGTCTLTFTFTPSIPGTEWATYWVYDNAGGTPQKLPLKGTGQ